MEILLLKNTNENSMEERLHRLRVSAKEIKEAKSKISRKEITEALVRDYWSVSTKATLCHWRKLMEAVKKTGGERRIGSQSLQRSFVPIPSVGCYVPGGQARYPSSVVMSVTPAKTCWR